MSARCTQGPVRWSRGDFETTPPCQASSESFPAPARMNGMVQAIGHRVWAIAEGFIPASSTGPEEMTSHESACLLNASDRDADVRVTVFFSDREPAGPYRLKVPARRTLHFWFNELDDPEPIPPATDYSSVISSSVPIVVQHTRLDSRQPANALISTLAFPVPDQESVDA